MRQSISIVKSTALEILSEPLTLLVLLTALALTVLAPAFHYHQFGEATRMARDAGLSALLMGGLVVAVFGTIRAFRREVESGTLAMALSHPVSRTGFFLAKTAGAFVACLFFSLTVFLTSQAIVAGAAVGGEIAKRSGDLARLWGPALAAGLGVIVLPLIGAAILNRFGRFRFVLSAQVLALAFSSAAGAFGVARAGVLLVRMVPAALLLGVLTAVLLSAAAAFSVRFRASQAATASGLVFAAFLPAVGNYYLSDALSNGGSVPWSYVGMAALAALPAILLFLVMGMHFINGRDFS